MSRGDLSDQPKLQRAEPRFSYSRGLAEHSHTKGCIADCL